MNEPPPTGALSIRDSAPCSRAPQQCPTTSSGTSPILDLAKYSLRSPSMFRETVKMSSEAGFYPCFGCIGSLFSLTL